MEIAKPEFAAVVATAAKANEEVATELRELELSLIGGGIGDVVLG